MKASTYADSDALALVRGEVADHDHRHLVGGDEARSSNPTARAACAPPGASSPTPVGSAGRRRTSPARRPTPSRRCRAWRRDRASTAAGWSSSTSLQLPLGRAGAGQRQQRGDDDEVGQDRAPRGGEEPAPALQVGVGDADQPVEQDLDQEDPGQRRAHRAEQVGVDLGRDRDAVEPEDQRRGDDGDRRSARSSTWRRS